MLKITRFEEKVEELFERGDLAFAKGLIHLYIGEEAVAVGACANLRKEDYATGTHRGHGNCIAKEPETAFKAIESTIVQLVSKKILKYL